MHDEDLRPAKARQLPYMIDDRVVVRRILQRHEDLLVHRSPSREELHEQPDIERCNDGCNDERYHLEPQRVCKFAHFFPVRREYDKGEDSERELHAEDHLAENEELGGAEMHARISGLADYLAEDERDAIRIGRRIIAP